jgi:hypothetical protein
MSQESTPSWLPDLFKTVGRIEAMVAHQSDRMDRADRQRERMEEQLATVTQTLSQAWSPGQTGGSRGPERAMPHSTPASMPFWTGWVMDGLCLAASLPWKKLLVGGVVAATVIEHTLAPAGWLGQCLRWVAGLKLS